MAEKRIERYPRITFRISLSTLEKLEKIAKGRGGKSKIIKGCLECFLNNPNCQANKYIKKFNTTKQHG